MATQRDRQGAPAHIMGPRIILLLSVLALMLIGFVMIYSTSAVITLAKAGSEAVDPMGETLNQIKFAVAGVVIAAIIWKLVPVSLWRSNAVWAIWAVAFALLVVTAVAGVGDEEWGARRWLMIGSASLQASEFAKIALVLVAARLFSDFREGQYSVWVFFALVGLLVLAPVLIILGPQSDLGTAMICVVGILAVMWLGEVPLRTMLIVIAVVVALGLVGIFGSSYRRDRLMVFMNPWNDGEGGFGTGYQLIHSLYALSGGGLFGVGLGNSHEKYLYLTQADTDFIFAIIGEELGLVGAAVVIALFLLFLYAGTRIAQSSPDNFGTMVRRLHHPRSRSRRSSTSPWSSAGSPWWRFAAVHLVGRLVARGHAHHGGHHPVGTAAARRGAGASTIADAPIQARRATNDAPPPRRGERLSSSRGRR